MPSATRSYAADAADGTFEPLDHAGRDVLAVPHPPYADTTGTPGVPRWYAVATLSDVHVEGPRSTPVESTTLAEPVGAVLVDVDASTEVRPLPRPWRPMIGSEHLSHTTFGGHHGRPSDRGRAHRRAPGRTRGAGRDPRPGARDPVRRPRCLPGGERRPGPRLLGSGPGLRPPARPGALSGGGAVVHAARPRLGPRQDGVRLRSDRLAAQGLGPLARPGPRPGRTPRGAVRPRRGRRALVLRGLERGQPRGLLVGHAGGVPAALRRHRGRREGGRPAAAGRWTVLRGGRLGRGAAGARRSHRHPGRLRHHPHLRLPAAGLPPHPRPPRTPGPADLVDRVGRDADPLQRGERRGLRRHVPAARHGLGDA